MCIYDTYFLNSDNVVQLQVFTRLNHLNITVSYNAVLKLALEIGELNEVPIKEWIKSDEAFKFVGDNVDYQLVLGISDLII